MKGLTVGRMVHFVDNDGVHSAAIVTRVVGGEENTVSLYVLHDDTQIARFEGLANYSEEPIPYTWHWSEPA